MVRLNNESISIFINFLIIIPESLVEYIHIQTLIFFKKEMVFILKARHLCLQHCQHW